MRSYVRTCVCVCVCMVSVALITTAVFCASSQESFVSASTWGTCPVSYSTATHFELADIYSMPGFNGGGKSSDSKCDT